MFLATFILFYFTCADGLKQVNRIYRAAHCLQIKQRVSVRYS